MEEAVARAVELEIVRQFEDDIAAWTPPPLVPSLQRILDLDRAGYTLEQIAHEHGLTRNSAKVMRNKARRKAKELGI